MTKQELQEFLNNKENWKLFEELANERALKYMPDANLKYANLSNANLRNADLSCSDLSHANLPNNKDGE